MKELLLYMAKNLVDDPEAVTVTEIDDEDGKVLELRVAEGDMGKVIGRQGRIAKEIRTIIKRRFCLIQSRDKQRHDPLCFYGYRMQRHDVRQFPSLQRHKVHQVLIHSRNCF